VTAAFAAIFILSYILTYLYVRYAVKNTILDVPNRRSSHTEPTPRGGGVALVFAWLAGLIYLRVKGMVPADLFLALMCGLPLTMVGFIDDSHSLDPRLRFLTQLACAVAGLFFLGGLKTFNIGILEIQSVWILTLLALVAVLWSVNLFNFLDGIDGYISMEVIFICAASFILTGDNLTLILAAAVLGFFIWNRGKAILFMGDSGSTLLGYNIAIFAVYHQNSGLSHIPVWLILTSVFWMDATITLLRRIKNREKLSVAHRKHAYQRIVQAGLSHQKTVLYAFIINIAGFLLAYGAFSKPDYDWLFLLADIALVFVIVMVVDRIRPFEK
jgi:UDP-N-acetylmuramyl pentapeptide phosphotransferase/UDP-N-acetylglucosamine-1-phosphate transferase